MAVQKLTPKRYEVIVGMIARGHYNTTAARQAGISPGTMQTWITRGVEEGDGVYYEFSQAVERAKEKGEGVLVGRIIDAADKGDWRAAAWILERKYSKNWSKKSQVEVGGVDGGPIEVTPVSPEKVAAAVQARLESAKVESNAIFE